MLFALCLLPYVGLQAQSNERTEILNVINQVFDAMRTNDSTLLKQCFVEQPNTFTVYETKEGETKLTLGDFQHFKSAVGKSKSQVWNEPIWNERVEIDGALASVWVDYAFYLGNTFHHCGVDAFHLMLTDDGWKIFHLVDTRRTEDCKVPKSVKKKYED